MQYIRKTIVLLLSCLLILSLTACYDLPDAGSAEPPTEEPVETPSETAEPEQTVEPIQTETAEVTTEVPAEPTAATVLYRVGSTGPQVAEIKERLIELGYLGPGETSQYFDLQTREAVLLFQETAGLETTGHVNAEMLDLLNSDEAPRCPEPIAYVTPEPSVEPEPSETADEAEPTPVQPLAGIRIGIDPGHQAQGSSVQEPIAPGSSETKPRVSSGTAGVKSGVAEYIVNLDVALKLRDILQGYGAEVVMTRETNGVDVSNSERAQIMNDAGVDLAVRIHCDGENDSSRHGAFILIPSGRYTEAIQASSRAAAECVLTAFVQTTGARDLGLSERSDQTGFNWSTVPVINIEMGHMSNPEEDLKLVDPDYQDLCAQGIALGILDYFAV